MAGAAGNGGGSREISGLDGTRSVCEKRQLGAVRFPPARIFFLGIARTRQARSGRTRMDVCPKRSLWSGPISFNACSRGIGLGMARRDVGVALAADETSRETI